MRSVFFGLAFLCVYFFCAVLYAQVDSVEAGTNVKELLSFEKGNPFHGSELVEANAIRLRKGYTSLERNLNFSDYDYLTFEADLDADEPSPIYIEIRDAETKDYWTRVNYYSILPPGKSKFYLPLKQLYVGEKSRPGRNLILDKITRFILNIEDSPKGPVTFRKMQLERIAPAPVFENLHAFDFGPDTSPLMDGFTPIHPGTVYSKERGYGLRDAKIWRSYDMKQPEPLYQDFISIESGGLAVDLPNGKYRVVMNIDSPNGFWGECQIFHKRLVRANGKTVLDETLNFERFQKWYYRFWEKDDLPNENTFDKYQKDSYREKTFDVEVKDGTLFIEFKGLNWACCVSSIIVFPLDRVEEGQKFLDYVLERRRFYFDNYFKRILHAPTGDPLEPNAAERKRGYVIFNRDFMEDIYYNDTPRANERTEKLYAEAFAGEHEPVTFSIAPLGNLGKVTVSSSSLQGPNGAVISASAIDIGYVSYRLKRITSEGTIYTIAPRFVMPFNEIDMPSDITRRFWLTVKTPSDAPAGIYTGRITVKTDQAENAELAFEFRVRKGTLEPVDVPVGPFGHSVPVPWQEDEPSREFYRRMQRSSLEKLREYGFNSGSGIPRIHYRGFENGKPVLDFSLADPEMALLKELGFDMFIPYGSGIQGFNPYRIDSEAMQKAGFEDYSEFIKAVYTEIQNHAEEHDWIPLYFYLADEPIGDDIVSGYENAEAYRKAFPDGPPFFTGASSYAGSDPNDRHMRLALAFHVVSWTLHSEESVRLLHEKGGEWAFYNGGSRWTFGDYMFKCVKEFDMKFRTSWHFNASAGNPYYALDCREDDYSWCHSSPEGLLIPSVEFERVREGLEDYRRFLTLERLAKLRNDSNAKKLIEERMRSFKLGERDHEKIFPLEDYKQSRRKIDDAIESLH